VILQAAGENRAPGRAWPDPSTAPPSHRRRSRLRRTCPRSSVGGQGEASGTHRSQAFPGREDSRSDPPDHCLHAGRVLEGASCMSSGECNVIIPTRLTWKVQIMLRAGPNGVRAPASPCGDSDGALRSSAASG
jgi:hypothetical protein